MTVSFESESSAKAALTAISHEGEIEGNVRSKLKFSQKGVDLHISADATDSVSLRAALNSVLRILSSIEQIEKDINSGHE